MLELKLDSQLKFSLLLRLDIHTHTEKPTDIIKL